MMESVLIRLLSTLATVTLLPKQANAQDGPRPEIEKIRQVVVSRTSIGYETLENDVGDTLIVAHTKYEDGTEVRQLAKVWVKAPLPLEILILENFVPTPRIVEEPHPDKEGNRPLPPGRHYNEISSHFVIEISQTTKFAASHGIVDVDSTESELGPCPDGFLRGFARLRAPGFPAMLNSVESRFDIGNLVCVRSVPLAFPRKRQ